MAALLATQKLKTICTQFSLLYSATQCAMHLSSDSYDAPSLSGFSTNARRPAIGQLCTSMPP